MNGNTALVIIIGTLCAYGAIKAIAQAWSDRANPCDCKRNQPDAPTE